MTKSESIQASVIVPTYNRAHIVSDTLNSILKQEHDAFEVIVVDDGSTDNTLGVLESYGDQIRVLRQAHQGSATARNWAAREARGKYLAFCDDDDVWLPDHLRLMCELLGAYPKAGMAFSNALFFVDNFNCASRPMMRPKYLRLLEKRRLTPKDLFLKYVVTTLSVVVVTKSAFESIGGFNEKTELVVDADLAFRMSLKHDIVFLNKITCHRRILKDGLVATMRYEDIYLEILEELHEKDPALRAKVGELTFRRRLAIAFSKAGRRCATTGDWDSAKNAFERARYWAWWNPRHHWHWLNAIRNHRGNSITPTLG